MRLLAFAPLALLLAGPAFAVDGSLEINQTCAADAGCFPGDAASFPVTITERGSYRLTGDLTPPPDVVGIEIGADDVMIDLNGFGIHGNLTCAPGACTGAGPARGISVPASPLTNGRRCTVRNGTITGINGTAIVLRDEAFVDAVSVSHTFTHGIILGPNSLATRNRITSVGRAGLFLGVGSGYGQNVIAATGQFFSFGSVVGGKAVGGNVCDDGRCSFGRRYYLTNTATFDGDQADELGTCAPGFHMASLWELRIQSNLTYDVVIGLTRDDSGTGPPSGLDGWARNGDIAIGSPSLPGRTNCLSWSTSSASELGTTYGLTTVVTGSFVDPTQWFQNERACSQTSSVWCIED